MPAVWTTRLAVTLSAALGCGGPPRAVAAAPTLESSCPGGADAAQGPEPTASIEEHAGARIVAIEVTAPSPELEELALEAVETEVDEDLRPAKVALDVRRLWALAPVDQILVSVRHAPGGVALAFSLRPAPQVSRVDVVGSIPEVLPPHLARVHHLRGTLFDGQRVHEIGLELRRHLTERGYDGARVETHRSQDEDGVALCVAIHPGPRFVLAELSFPGHARLAASLLRRQLQREDDLNQPGGVLQRELLEADLPRISALYYDHGMIDVRVGRPTYRVDTQAAEIRVSIPVDEGPVYSLGRLRITGVDPDEARSLERAVPIETGQVFSRSRVIDTVAAVREAAPKRGAAAAAVSPVTSIDSVRHIVDLDLAVSWPAAPLEETSP